LLSLSGLITTAPLLMFAGAAKRMRYADLGLLQYIAPTMQLLLGVFAYGEPLLPVHLFTFGCIWSGLALYAISSWRSVRMVMIPE
jgi:chloramphenicol-sensitive protein RarD